MATKLETKWAIPRLVQQMSCTSYLDVKMTFWFYFADVQFMQFIIFSFELLFVVLPIVYLLHIYAFWNKNNRLIDMTCD